MAIAVGERAERHSDLVRGDVVECGGGEIVITRSKPQGQRFLWLGVKVRGHSGAEYKIPRGVRKTGHNVNHPALLNVRGGDGGRSEGGLDPSQKIVIGQLCDAIDKNDLTRAKVLAATVRALIA